MSFPVNISAASRRAIQFEGLAERRDFDELAFVHRALLNYVLVLEDRINPDTERLLMGGRYDD